MKNFKWNKRKFLNNVTNLFLGTSIITLPILGCLIYGITCNILGL